MMADFDLMELAPEQEDLAYLHQQLFSTATEVVSAGGEEPPMVVTDTTAATVTMLHDVTGFTGNYGNGNTTTEPKEDDKPAVYHGDGEALVGRSVVKKFKRTKYAGKVIGYDTECKWYKVKYEDDDEEELEYKELESLLVEAGEAEAVKAANAKKRAGPETDSDSKSPAKRPRGRPPGDKKTPAKTKAEKRAKAPKSPKTPKSPKRASSKRSEEASESLSTEKKNAATPGSGEKRGRGRPRKDSAVKPAKADSKGSGDSSSESKPSTRKSTSAQDKGESRSGRSPRGKSAGSPGPLSQKEGHHLIGAKIRKKFDGDWYNGEVTGFDPKMNYYKAKYSDGDTEEYTLKELKALLVEDQATPRTRGRPKSKDASPAKSAEGSPLKKQKVGTPKKDAAKAQNPARDGAQPRKRGRPSKVKSAAAEANDADVEASGKDSDVQENGGPSENKGSALTEPKRPYAALSAVRYASASNAENLEYYGWGEVVHCYRTRYLELAAMKLKPTTSPIVHLAASQHHLAALTAAGQVLVWRNQHGNIRTRCDGWEYISDLESKAIVFIDIAGPDIDRRSAGYGPEQEDQVPDPFYLDAVSSNGEDYLFQGSRPQEHVRTERLRDNRKIKGLRSTLSQINISGLKNLGLVVQASVGTVEALDETPFIGYITDTDQVYIRSATKEFMDEVNLVTGYTGKPLKIQCGGVYHAVLLTDDGRAWTWGHGYQSLPTSSQVSNSKNKNQSFYSTCHLALGTLVGRKVVDVGCYGEDFVALTSDGCVHHWTHGVANPAAAIFNTPSTPAVGKGPSVAPGDKIKRVSIGVGACAGVTEQGKVHTWRALWRGSLVGLRGPGTPLGREYSGLQTVVPSLGTKFAIQVMCVAGSLIVVAEKKAKGKHGPKN